jgi:predicted lipoprotein with Yx(FWY)xxD motif
MKRSTRLALVFLVTVAATASAAPRTCNIHPKKGATKEELAAMAKVTQADAQKAALASLKDPSKATVKGAELEAEQGCLVYSFDIDVAGKTGVQEVQVDAGNGKVLSSKHESSKAEAAEKAKEPKT